MGACVSSSYVEATKKDKDNGSHKEAEKRPEEPTPRTRKKVKVLLLGTGDSGKSTILKQIPLVHRCPLSPEEIESYRELIFGNLILGLRCVIGEMENMGLAVSPCNRYLVPLLYECMSHIGYGKSLPIKYHDVLKRLWEDDNVQAAYSRANEAALPDYLQYFYTDLGRFFERSYVPSKADIIQSHARTLGITETLFTLRDHDMLVVDVGGQRSERRKWIHCFQQDVTCVLFVVNLSGYDQCLIEDKHTNQMEDAMSVWDSICHSRWLERTPIILFLNKNDLFERKVKTSPIKNYFPDFNGEAGDAEAGREYFKKRFAKMALRDNAKERDIFITVTTATDTAALRRVMASVEGGRRAFYFTDVADGDP